MNRVEVESSDIKSIGYDVENRVLEIEFRKGGIYEYRNIGLLKYAKLMNAESRGKFFNENIKGNNSHPYLRISKTEKDAK